MRTPAYLRKSFTVAEIYQSLTPFRSHHDRLGITLNREYDELLIRLLAGEGGYLVLESEPAREAIRRELKRRHRNTGIYREFAAAKVRLNPARIPVDLPEAPSAATRATGEEGRRTGPAGRCGPLPHPASGRRRESEEERRRSEGGARHLPGVRREAAGRRQAHLLSGLRGEHPRGALPAVRGDPPAGVAILHRVRCEGPSLIRGARGGSPEPASPSSSSSPPAWLAATGLRRTKGSAPSLRSRPGSRSGGWTSAGGRARRGSYPAEPRSRPVGSCSS